MPIKNLIKLFMVFFIFLSLFFLIDWVDKFEVPHLHARDTCMQYIAEGTIYGGQPYCDQGVITYYVTFILSFIPINLDLTMIIFYIMSLLICLYFVYKIKKSATGNTRIILIIFLFLLLTLKHPDMPTAVGTMFLFSGFFYLFYTRREILGSVLLTFALFSKATVMVIIGPIFLFYIINKYLKNKNFNEVLKSISIIALPGIILLSIILIRFPNYLDYYYFLHSLRPEQETYSYILTSIFSFKYAYGGIFLLIYIGWLVTLIRALNKKFNVYSFITAISIPFLYIKFANAHNLFEALTHFRYFIPFFPFYIVNLYKIKAELSSYPKYYKSIFLIIIIILFIPLYQSLGGITVSDILDGSTFNDNLLLNKIAKEVSYPLLTINTTGMILASNDMPTIFGEDNSFLYINKSQFMNKSEYIQTTLNHEPLDYTYADFIVELGVVESLEPYEPIVSYNDSVIVDNLYNGAFDVIILWPYLDYTTHVLKNHKEYLNENYCLIMVPFLIGPHIADKDNYVLVYIKDEAECQKLTSTMIEYYQQNIDNLCHRSNIIVEEITKALALDKIKIIENCKSITKTGVVYTRIQMQEAYFALFVLIFLLIISINAFYNMT